MDLTFMRQGYQNEGLTKEQLSPDPFLQFEAWLKEANEAEPIPNAMSLATVNHSGAPMMRTVLLKLFDDNGFVFFTNLLGNFNESYQRYLLNNLRDEFNLEGVPLRLKFKNSNNPYIQDS